MEEQKKDGAHPESVATGEIRNLLKCLYFKDNDEEFLSITHFEALSNQKGVNAEYKKKLKDALETIKFFVGIFN